MKYPRSDRTSALPRSPRRVTVFPLSHRMGEGRGEGSSFSSCEGFDLKLLTVLCLFAGPDNCGSTLRGPKNGFGISSVRGAWRDTNSVASIMKGLTIWTFIVWRQSSPWNWMASAMASRCNTNTTCEETLFSRAVAFWLNASGIINSLPGKSAKIWKRIFGEFYRNGCRIRKIYRYLRIGGNRTTLEIKNPHPDPLPSDGRGEIVHTFLDKLCSCWFSRFSCS